MEWGWGRVSRLFGGAGAVRLSLVRGGDRWGSVGGGVEREQVGNFGGPMLPCSPFLRRLVNFWLPRPL